MIEVDIRQLPHGEGLPLPAYETAGAAGMDLRAAEDMPGTRAIIDHHVAHPTGPEMARTLGVATAKEHEMLALMAGRASGPGEGAARVGRSIADAARTSYVPGARTRTATHAPSLVQRLRAVLAA